jgi:pyruvate kinase
MDHRTKIGVTLGPACADQEVFEKMVNEGVDFIRLNFSHGTYETHAEAIKLVREVSKKLGKNIDVLQDLQGPKIRLGTLPDEGVSITPGQSVVLNTNLVEYAGNDLPVTLPHLEESLLPEERILVDDGLIELRVVEIEGSRIITQAINEGVLKSHKGMNFPDTTFTGIPALSEKDKSDVQFGIKQDVDIIALSFVKEPGDVQELKDLVNEIKKNLGRKKDVRIIAKIERPEAVKNIIKVLEKVDGIMIARGDLGMEMPEEELPITQKNLIAAAKAVDKPVMVATQLLYSMEHNIRPSRAEVNDIANAVIDGATSLLLTNETAVGEHPVEAVKVLHDTIVAAEASKYDDKND